MSVRLYVGNLPYQTTESELRQHFSVVGAPTSVILPTDRETGRLRGFAFVDFAEAEQAEAAMRQLQGQTFGGRSLTLSPARPREARGPAPRPSMPMERSPMAASAHEARQRNFGPDALPRGQRRGKGPAGPKPRGPIRERPGGRRFHIDSDGPDDGAEMDARFSLRGGGSEHDQD